jgi:hypothetical protein
MQALRAEIEFLPGLLKLTLWIQNVDIGATSAAQNGRKLVAARPASSQTRAAQRAPMENFYPGRN